MNWKFWKKPIKDRRVWNDDWQVGDIAEALLPQDSWDFKDPWECPAKGARLTVIGLSEGVCEPSNARAYFLRFAEIDSEWATQGFRKVRPIAKKQSAIAEKILSTPNPKEIERKVKETTKDTQE